MSIAAQEKPFEEIQHARRERTVGAGEAFVVASPEFVEVILDDLGEDASGSTRNVPWRAERMNLGHDRLPRLDRVGCVFGQVQAMEARNEAGATVRRRSERRREARRVQNSSAR